jgi:hypothetical protein
MIAKANYLQAESFDFVDLAAGCLTAAAAARDARAT